MKWYSAQKLILPLLLIGLFLPGRTTLASDVPDINATLLSAQNGDSEAQFTLGEAYRQGKCAAKDPKQAEFWYTRAAMDGHEAAQYQLGLMYETGEGVPQDYTKALDWYGKAAEQGNTQAKTHKEKILASLDGLKRSAENGKADAQCTLGGLYAQGNGFAHDDETAVAWYRKAAEQGSAKGQFLLGFMYDQGRGVSQEDQEALSWYQKSAAQGYADAEYHLSALYYNGKGVPRDPVSAYAWLSLAAAQGQRNALENKAFASSRLTPGQLNQAQALADKLQAKINSKH